MSFEDRTFIARVLRAPVLAERIYADRPPLRTNDWGRLALLPDTADLRRVSSPLRGFGAVSAWQTVVTRLVNLVFTVTAQRNTPIADRATLG